MFPSLRTQHQCVEHQSLQSALYGDAFMVCRSLSVGELPGVEDLLVLNARSNFIGLFLLWLPKYLPFLKDLTPTPIYLRRVHKQK